LYRGPETHWSLVGPAGKAVELRVASRMRCNSGEVAHDWALAGCGLIMKSWVDVAPDVQAGRLVRVLTEWRSEHRLFGHAASGKSHDAALLKTRIARFLHDHKDASDSR
jgi:DNA-binding transcriptional LysR family regulator